MYLQVIGPSFMTHRQYLDNLAMFPDRRMFYAMFWTNGLKPIVRVKAPTDAAIVQKAQG